MCEEETYMCVPVQRRYAVDGLEAAACGHHIEAVSAVTGHVEVVFGVAVLHHHDEPRPAVGQVIARHALAPLRAQPHTNEHNQKKWTHRCISPTPKSFP